MNLYHVTWILWKCNITLHLNNCHYWLYALQNKRNVAIFKQKKESDGSNPACRISVVPCKYVNVLYVFVCAALHRYSITACILPTVASPCLPFPSFYSHSSLFPPLLFSIILSFLLSPLRISQQKCVCILWYTLFFLMR